MSTVNRLMSSSLAICIRIVITLVTQIALVPIYLKHWDVKTYGYWVALQGIIFIASTFDRGHVDYLGFEILRINQLAKSKISELLYSGLIISVIVGAVELILVYSFSFSKYLYFFIGDQNTLNVYREIGFVLLFQWISWTFFSNNVNLFFKALIPFGYYPRVNWWYTVTTLVSTIVSVLVVITNGTLFKVGVYNCFITILMSLLQLIDGFRIMSKEGFTKAGFTLKKGFYNYYLSLGLSTKYFFENFRQHGIRVILSPLLGSKRLAVFSTIRTSSNVILQGLSIVSYPVLPELILSNSRNESKKSEILYSSLWLIIMVFLIPLVILIQYFAKDLFGIWTNGKMIFDPMLFCLLSVSTLVYGLSQPVIAIITGNNLLKIQFFISIVTSLILILGTVYLVPSYGVKAVGLVLLIVEIITYKSCEFFAVKWVKSNRLVWPTKLSHIASNAVTLTALGTLASVIFPLYNEYILMINLVFNTILIVMFYNSMPLYSKGKYEKAALQLLNILSSFRLVKI